MRTAGYGPVRPVRADPTAKDAGSAVVEFSVLGVLLLVPLVYLAITLSQLQAASFATDRAAREAGRAFTTATSEDEGRARAVAATRLAYTDHGLTDQAAGADSALSLSCEVQPCLQADGRVRVTVATQVSLPGIPDVLSSAVPTSVTVRSEHVAVVGRFRGDLP